MRQWSTFAAATIGLILGGCATMTRGTTEQLQINSDPPNAMARTSTGYSCMTPCMIEVSRKQEFNVVFSKAGYQDQVIEVKSQLSGGGAAGLAGSAVLGGLVGFGTDVATGASLEHVPNPISVQLIPMMAPRLPARPRKPAERPSDKANDS